MRNSLKYDNRLDWFSRVKQLSFTSFTTLIVTTFVLTSLLAGPGDTSELSEEHLAVVSSYQKAISEVESFETRTLSTSLASGLRWDQESAKWQTFHSNPGIAVLRIFQDRESDNQYIIAGDRFGSKQLKASISGGIDPDKDQRLSDVYNRELKEEYFGYLPVKESRTLTANSTLSKARDFVVLGGFETPEMTVSVTAMNTILAEYEDAAVAPLTQIDPLSFQLTHAGWGPCFTWVELEVGYNIAELTQALKIMNQNADLHCPVANFYHRYESKAVAERQQGATDLLKVWTTALEKDQEDKPIPLHEKVMQHLKEITENGDAALPDGFDTGFDFAKRYVHDYTEYKSFHLIPLDDWLRFIATKKKSGTGGEKFFLPGLEEYQLFTGFGADQWFNQHLSEIAAKI
ncbi:MAG: hypothetical protein CMM87_03980 [Rickettsiales bacterium]|mgnify:CR=1 FL=1|nr:hypothetical protein [Rickettsiales bacterium]|tara:strand:- start:55858 stop:57066 length:1209 start_codon:yes stop_codon:yes gene_type:complete